MEVLQRLQTIKKTLICQVDDYIISTFKDRFSINSPISNAIELMFEYAKTPLDEREEEKKYRLRMPIAFGDYNLNYLNKRVNGKFMILDKITRERFQDKFTQKEIDAMPFDTNFFIKEEVK